MSTSGADRELREWKDCPCGQGYLCIPMDSAEGAMICSECLRPAERIVRHSAFKMPVKPSDEITLEYSPGRETEVYLNGYFLGSIDAKDLSEEALEQLEQL